MTKYDYSSVFEIFNKYYANNLADIPEPAKSLIIIISSKGIIDNGGFEYFMESDYPDNYQHKNIADNYKHLGLIRAFEIVSEACDIVGDVVGLSYDNRKIKLNNNKKRLSELASEYYELGKEIEEKVQQVSEEYCNEFHSDWKIKIKLRIGRLLANFRMA